MYKVVLTYLAMMIAVSFAGEMKFYPFENYFRVSLGTPVFFFFLLWSRKIHPILAGIFVGLSVMIFRMLLAMYSGDASFEEMIMRFFPVFFYYVMFGFLFQLLKVKSFYYRPFRIGLAGTIIEIIATLTEIFVRMIFYETPFTHENLLVIVGIAAIRSFFVLGIFNMLIISDMRQSEKEQRKRYEEMLVLISNLHIETIQLKKVMKNAEQSTSGCYALYRDLKESDKEENAKTALKIAGEIHEIKKDSQRIYAGLSKLMDKEKLSDYLPLTEIIDVIVTANSHYAKLLNKQIQINAHIDGKHPKYDAFVLLSIINNLVTNAVEAIDIQGEILLTVTLNKNFLCVHVRDNGTGIDQGNERLVFTPGFTTKFDQYGRASSGIGLTYVKEMIMSLNGEMSLENSREPYKTVFKLNFPLESLTEKG